MKTLIAAVALTLMATAANADTLPKRFHGQWCFTGEGITDEQTTVSRCKTGDVVIKPKGFSGVEEDCALQSVRPVPSGKYGAVMARFKCKNDERSSWTANYWIGFYDDEVLFLMPDKSKQ